MKTIITLALVCFVFCLTGCTSLNKSNATIKAAIDHFHQQYNEGNAGAIWTEAHAKFRNTTEKTSFETYLLTVQRKLGKVTSTANVDLQRSIVNQTTTVHLSQTTAFEKGKGMETFTLEMVGEDAVLVAYNVQSKELSAK